MHFLTESARVAGLQEHAAMLGPRSRLALTFTRFEMPATPFWNYALPIDLLLGSNIFMTLAWYGHLRFKDTPLATVILAAWGIAFIEYCMAVPANRWGNDAY